MLVYVVGMMDVDNFIARLAQVMNDNEPSIIAARAERFV